MADVFTYGTLMDVEIMNRVSGQRLQSEPATLKNYVRKCVKNKVYPGIISKPMSAVHGQLYRQVSRLALERLDRFEGELYRREIVTVHRPQGKRIPAYAYVVLAENRALLSSQDWTLEWFLEHGKSSFKGEYEGFNQV